MILKPLKKQFILAALIYFGTVLFGVFSYFIVPYDLGEMGINTKTNWLEYFIHNGTINLIIIFSFLSLGLITVGSLLLNGIVMGYMFGHAIQTNAVMKFLLLLAPHGIIEIPTAWLASAVSFFIISYTIKKIKNKEKIDFKFLIFTILKYTIITEILILIAGIIEENITLIS
ncbi:hypothetical protein CN917_26030 [Bacillus thuringiensis]|uniref:stage II sporulation protein M n=2 Tax=Bacillaceae TaxID=186817 RepID=UPI00068FE747|nr:MULTISPECIES: stage II sporulation protein M [Bacillus]OTX42234.1 hypothetical protein BK717_03270 [Bacillus thuringiensis serovar malayensis]OUB02571.1 hypothetical protein BK709_26035 [Bacillus thuringiensis serovar shandongiensis]HDR4557480.1 stage II sporulation protein M [Bacillus cereus]MDM5258277.1 stage II sporulation protein M [Bacillus toyonensis]MEC2392911.1 stage II sporulation protein M [Bacillus toyonensis]